MFAVVNQIKETPCKNSVFDFSMCMRYLSYKIRLAAVHKQSKISLLKGFDIIEVISRLARKTKLIKLCVTHKNFLQLASRKRNGQEQLKREKYNAPWKDYTPVRLV